MTGMTKRFFYLTALLLPAGALHALGLGEIHVNSALNQPLSAQIDLLSATPDELSSLRAGLANPETFARYRIDRSPALTSLEFKVTRSAAGRDVLQVTSRQAIADPFLTFLVEVNWARGQLLREYTVLLDPPVYLPEGKTASGTEAASEPVAVPQTTSSETSRGGSVQRSQETVQRSQAPEDTASAETSTAAASPRPSRPAAPAPAPSPVGDAESYTVRSNDTLWRIASQLSGSTSGREVNRMMVALYRANPEAFAGNINQLRAGAVLRIPAANDVQSIGSGEAAAEVYRQYAEWRPGRDTAGTGATESESRLKLVAPTEKATSGTAPAAPSAAASAESQALRDRVRNLEGELTESKRLLDLKSAELARLQQQLGQQPPAATAPPPAEAPVPEAIAPPAEAPAPGPGETPAPPAEPAAEQAQPSAPTPEKPAEPAPGTTAEAPSGPSLVDRLIEYWYFPVAALLILGGAIFFMRRRQEPDFDELGRLAEGDADSLAREPRFGRESGLEDLKPAKRDSDAFLVEESGEHAQPDIPEPDVARTVRPNLASTKAEPVKTTDDTLSSETAINLDQGDPLAEADFHMAYGLYDQAADLVRMAIEREPQRRDLKLKLLEIFFVWGNKDAFLQTARQLHDSRAQAPAGEWDKIVIMGKQIAADDPLFAQASTRGAAPAGDVDLNLESGDTRVDLDILGDSGEKRIADASMDFDLGSDLADTGESPVLKDSTGIDFLLDEPLTGGADSSATTREMAARTQEVPTSETPTVESPALGDRASSTIKEKIDSALLRSRESHSPDQTAELAIDDLGLDLGDFSGESNDALEDTNHPAEALEATDHPRDLLEETDHPSDAATMLASSLRSNDRESSTGTWVIDDKTLAATSIAPSPGDEEDDGATLRVPSPSGGDTVQRRRFDTDSTSELESLKPDDMDLDLDRLEKALSSDTVEQPRRGFSQEEDQFSSDVFGEGQDLIATDIDLDTGAVNRSHDRDPTKTERIPAQEMGLPELEPVTMSEVGTKLDLARAYMDMGDPEGARNILEEVLSEGSATQKQEAQRLLDSLPG